MNSNEFSPYNYFTRVINLWWVVALATILGGLFGYIFFQLNPPIYEATATYVVTIDLESFPIQDVPQDMLQYNEDMALNTTKAILLSPEVRQQVVSSVNELGISVTPEELVRNYTIERKHDIWELRYRSKNPQDAQTLAKTWAEIGYQAMIASQQTGKVPAYVVFEPPSSASMHQVPVVMTVIASSSLGLSSVLLEY
jgi:uncharacterized protein involved in exopolysaccharide biosynthesis